MIFLGSEWDLEKVLSGREGVVETFHSFTGRKDIRFGKMATLFEYKWVVIFLSGSRRTI